MKLSFISRSLFTEGQPWVLAGADLGFSQRGRSFKKHFGADKTVF